MPSTATLRKGIPLYQSTESTATLGKIIDAYLSNGRTSLKIAEFQRVALEVLRTF